MKAKIEIELEINSISELSSEQDILDCIMEDLQEGVQKVIANITDNTKLIACKVVE